MLYSLMVSFLHPFSTQNPGIPIDVAKGKGNSIRVIKMDIMPQPNRALMFRKGSIICTWILRPKDLAFLFTAQYSTSCKLQSLFKLFLPYQPYPKHNVNVELEISVLWVILTPLFPVYQLLSHFCRRMVLLRMT